MTERQPRIFVPTEPLRKQLRLAGLAVAAPTTQPGYIDYGFRELARKYHRRFPGVSWETPNRQIFRIMNQSTVTLEVADRWCVVLGLHPVLLWPELYREAA